MLHSAQCSAPFHSNDWRRVSTETNIKSASGCCIINRPLAGYDEVLNYAWYMNRFLKVTLDGRAVGLMSPPLYFSKGAPGTHWQEGWVCSGPDLATSFTSRVKPVARKTVPVPFNKRLGGSQILSGCCRNSFFATVENLLPISRSSSHHSFQLDLPNSIPYFEYLTMVYANI